MNNEDLRQVFDKSQIESVMARYVQGVDHRDSDLLKSCYHPDAYEMHHIFNGNAHDFAEWRVRQTFRSHHMLSTSAIAFEGDSRALVETPHTAVVQVDIDEQGQRGVIEIATAGWYLDLFSQRDGVWKIDFQRVVTLSNSMRLIPGDNGLAKGPPGGSAVDPFKLGFALDTDRPAPSHVDDVAAGIRAAFLAQKS